MRRRVVWMLALVVLAPPAVLIGGVPSAGAAVAPVKSGWWWRVNDPVLPTPLAPPDVSEGALMVAGTLEGATAIAALRFELSEGATPTTLTLDTVADGGGQTAVMAACVTGSFWNAASAGRWNDKPSPACAEGAAPGVRSEDGTKWSFAIAHLVVDGVLDVVIVPGALPEIPPGLPNGSTFQLVFAKPGETALTTGAAPAPAVIEVTQPAVDPSAFAPPAFDTPVFATRVPEFTPSLPEEEQGLTPTAPTRTRSPSVRIEDEADDPRWIAVLVLALCVGTVLWTTQAPQALRHRLRGRTAVAGEPLDEADAAPVIGGLGRFARPRAGSAPPL